MDKFTKNVILIFIGTFLVNFLNLLYQLLIAHRFTPEDFAAFNSLLSLFMLISTPLATLQTVIAKYSAEFNARNEVRKVHTLLFTFLKNTFVLAALTFFVFCCLSLYITEKLKIDSFFLGYILAMLLAFSWVNPVVSGGLQGLESFKWLMSISLLGGILKLALAFIFICLGFSIAGALGAFLISSLIGIILGIFALKKHFYYSIAEDRVNFKEILTFIFPVTISTFCFMGLVNIDMVLVRYYFTLQDSGLYSLGQMIGKIFLFLPAAISIAMFPRTSSLNAKSQDTAFTLRRSLLYGAVLCLSAGLFYNLFPYVTLSILTGKAFAESIFLGRLFSVSMSFFALLYILVSYFLSIKDLRFIKYLALCTVFQVLAIVLFHKSLIQIQGILCLNSILLFSILFILSKSSKAE